MKICHGELTKRIEQLESKVSNQETSLTDLKNKGISSVKLENIETLTSTSQLTHAGFYSIAYMTEEVNKDVINNMNFDDYNIRRF